MQAYAVRLDSVSIIDFIGTSQTEKLGLIRAHLALSPSISLFLYFPVRTRAGLCRQLQQRRCRKVAEGEIERCDERRSSEHLQQTRCALRLEAVRVGGLRRSGEAYNGKKGRRRRRRRTRRRRGCERGEGGDKGENCKDGHVSTCEGKTDRQREREI